MAKPKALKMEDIIRVSVETTLKATAIEGAMEVICEILTDERIPREIREHYAQRVNSETPFEVSLT